MPNIDINLTKPTEAYFEISESNSLVYILQEEDSIYYTPTIFNTFSFNEDAQIAEECVHRFNENDRIPTQFRSNYATNNVKYITNGALTSASITKTVHNISLKTGYDCKIKEYVGGKTAIYFESGYTLDYDTEEIQEEFELNGFLPEFCKVDNYIEIGDLGVFQIEAIETDDTGDLAIIDLDISAKHQGVLDIYVEDNLLDFARIETTGDIALNLTARNSPSLSTDFQIGVDTGETVLNLRNKIIELTDYYVTLINGRTLKVSKTDDSVLSTTIVQTPSTATVTFSTSLVSETEMPCYSVYNRANYDVYEFTTVMGGKDVFNIGVEAIDTTFDDLVYISEKIKVTDSFSNFVEVVWYSDENTSDLDYSNNFYSLARLEITNKDYANISDNKNNKTDNTIISIGANNYDSSVYEFRGVTTMLARKLAKAFASDQIYINRINHNVEKEFEVEKLGQTNTYKGEVELVQSERLNPNKQQGYAGDRLVVYPYTEITQGIGFMQIGTTFTVG